MHQHHMIDRMPASIRQKVRTAQRGLSIYDREHYIGYSPESDHWYAVKSDEWDWHCGYDDELVAAVESDGRIVPIRHI